MYTPPPLPGIVTLAWDPSTDNSKSVTYTIYKDGQAFIVPQAAKTTYTIDWLSPGMTYSFYVTAGDACSTPSSARHTGACAPLG